MKTKPLRVLVIAIALTLVISELAADPLGRAFTYQGRLNDGGAPANGNYDLKFTLYDAAGGGASVINAPLTNAATPVNNGLFTVVLDFGPGACSGDARWLEIAARTNGSVSDFVILSPRQSLTVTPFARYAASAGSAASAAIATTASSVSVGAVDNAALQTGAVDASKIAAAAITATNLSPTVLSNTFWRLEGNAGTTPGVHFLGTTDNQPLHLNVNGAVALRLEPTTSVPNLIGGWSGNCAAPGVVGATIAGGGNPATPSSNRIAGSWSFIGGGTANEVGAPRSVIAGGVGNVIEGGGTGVAIGGGSQNLVQTNTLNALIAGGSHNTIQSNANVAAIGGGGYNVVRSNALAATIPGGFENEVSGSYGFAAGRRARANHPGAFVWSDSILTPTGFASTGSNQFLINAGGGVGIGTNNPQSALHVAGTITADYITGSGAGLTAIPLAALPTGVITNQQTGVTLHGTFNAAKGLVIENRTSDPPSPAVGQIWLRTDL